VVLLAAPPGAIRRLLETRDPYFFSQRFFADMLARLSGPGRLRFILQPAVAILPGRRDGVRDAREQLPAFLSRLIVDGGDRRELLRSAVRSVREPRGHRSSFGHRRAVPHRSPDSPWRGTLARSGSDRRSLRVHPSRNQPVYAMTKWPDSCSTRELTSTDLAFCCAPSLLTVRVVPS
jgi:hypothetical protein